jgi:hypothetical protein
MAVCVFIFIVIVIAGGVLFLWSEYGKIEENRTILNSRRAELENLEGELGIDKFEILERSIILAYEDGKDASAVFYNDEMTTYEADRLIRSVLSGVSLNLDNLTVNQMFTHSFMLSIFREYGISYGIKEMAVIGEAGDRVSDEGEEGAEGAESASDSEGEAAADSGEVISTTPTVAPEDATDLETMIAFMMNAPRVQAIDFFEENITNQARAAHVVTAMREFLANETETVAMQNVRFEIPMTRAEAFALSMHVFNLGNATYIAGMSTAELQPGTYVNEYGEITQGGAVPDGTRLYTVDIMFFIVEPMEQPNFDYSTRFTW